jgi:hypothetical protein
VGTLPAGFPLSPPRFTPNRATRTTGRQTKTTIKRFNGRAAKEALLPATMTRVVNIAIAVPIDMATILQPPPVAIAAAQFRIANDGNRGNPYFPGSSSSSSGTGKIGELHGMNRIFFRRRFSKIAVNGRR